MKKINMFVLKIEELLSAPEEGFKIEGTEVGMVCVLGQITNVDSATTKITYQVHSITGLFVLIKLLNHLFLGLV